MWLVPLVPDFEELGELVHELAALCGLDDVMIFDATDCLVIGDLHPNAGVFHDIRKAEIEELASNSSGSPIDFAGQIAEDRLLYVG